MLVQGRYKVIHDLRRDYDQLYDLTGDPGERRNLAAERPDLLAPLHLTLERRFGLTGSETLVARLGDGDASVRAAAARELGAAEALAATPRLAAALDDSDPAVRREAALALGALGDERARAPLALLLADPAYRSRAGLMLGRLRDPRAIAALFETAAGGATLGERRHAIHYLGFVGDDRAVEPLARAAADVRVRTEAYEALGRMAARLGSDRIANWLAGRLAQEARDDARARLAWALSQHRTPLVVSALVAAMRRAPPPPLASEALVRLGAVGREVGGVDFGPDQAVARGLTDCRAADPSGPVRFAAATTCLLYHAAELRLRMPLGGAGSCVVRARSTGGCGTLEVRSGATAIARIPLSGDHVEVAVPCRWPRGVWPLRLTFEPAQPSAEAAAELDHLLVVPSGAPLRAAVTRRPL
jgi:HEAT repeat protein